jgi:hypothetical protein
MEKAPVETWPGPGFTRPFYGKTEKPSGRSFFNGFPFLKFRKGDGDLEFPSAPGLKTVEEVTTWSKTHSAILVNNPLPLRERAG